MADLLSPSDKAQLEQGFKDVMQTTHQTDVLLYIRTSLLDLKQTNEVSEYAIYGLKTIVKEVRKVNDEGVEGSRDINNIALKFHRQDFIDLSLVGLGGELLFNSSESFIVHKGKTFRVVSLEVEDIAVRIQAEHSPTTILNESLLP